MILDQSASGSSLFTAMFSDEPVPDVEAAIVVAHPGDESLNASWLMVRLQEHASVFCLTKVAHGCAGRLPLDSALNPAAVASARTIAAARLAGVPEDRCHNLGLSESELARDLESLVWLTTAAVVPLQPRMLVTHCCEGENLDHDATAFAVHMTARLLMRGGGVAPMVVECPHRHDAADAPTDEALALAARQAVCVEFGPESRKVKRRMLRCHVAMPSIDIDTLHGESYILAKMGNPAEHLVSSTRSYVDAPWCGVADFRRNAQQVAASLQRAMLTTPSRA